MKNILFFALLIFPLSAYSQDDGDSDNFSIIDGKIVWVKVFEFDGNVDDIKAELYESGIFCEVFNERDDRITGMTRRMKSLYNEMGYKYLTTDFMAGDVEIWGKITAQVKDGRYRITIEEITIQGVLESHMFGDMPYQAESILVKRNGELRDRFKNISPIWDYTFAKNLTINPVGDEW